MSISEAISSLDWNREPMGLYNPIAYALSSGGKRLRPQLVVMGCELFGGKGDTAMPAALAIEIFHNFTLLHDDVMDKAAVRRGRPTVHVQWNDNTAILSGDQMVIEAYKQISRLPDAMVAPVMRIFNQMGTQICEGQQWDMDFETREDVSIEAYLNMIRLKTSVLLGAALQIGALIGGADSKQQEAIYQFGVHIGLAFQIQDDILDVYGDPQTFGKAIGGDILCNKKTYLLLSAQEQADPATQDEIAYWLQEKGDSPEKAQKKIRAVRAIYDRLDIRRQAETLTEQYTRKGLDYLDALPQNEVTSQLRNLAHQLIHRKI